MAVNLNLLPPEKAVSKSLAGILKVTRALGIISLAAFLIFVAGATAFFVIENVRLGSINSANDILKSQIASQETSEQKIVLLKDRLGKIAKAQSQPNSRKNIGSVGPLITNLPGNSSVTELTIDPAKVSATMSFKSNADLSAFIDSLKASSVFKTVTLTAFSFSPASGYTVTFDGLNK